MYSLGIENESKSFNLFGNLYNSSCLPRTAAQLQAIKKLDRLG